MTTAQQLETLAAQQENDRKALPMRKFSALLALLLVAGIGVVQSSPAQAAPQTYRNYTVFYTPDGATATATTCIVKLSSNTMRLCQSGTEGSNFLNWDTSVGGGKFKMNALCLDFEEVVDNYSQWWCQGDGNSLTLDDVPTSGGLSIGSSATVSFQNSDSPALRVRFYGVGSGSIQNRRDDFATIG